MALDTKLRLNNNKFIQLTGDTLTLSGETQVGTKLNILSGGTVQLSEIPTSGSSSQLLTRNPVTGIVEYRDSSDFGAAGATVQLSWRFNSSTAGVDPGNKRFAYDSSTPSGITEIDVNDFSNSGADASAIIAALEFGDKIYIQQTTSAQQSILFTVTGSSIDNTTHWVIPVKYEDEGDFGLHSNNADCGWIILFGAGSASDFWKTSGVSVVTTPTISGDTTFANQTKLSTESGNIYLGDQGNADFSYGHLYFGSGGIGSIGICRTTTNNLQLDFGGVDRWQLSSSHICSLTAGGACFSRSALPVVYGFSGNGGTGLGWNGTNDIGLYTGALEAINIDSGQTVTIQSVLNLATIPTSGSSGQILTRDGGTGEVQYASIGDLGGGVSDFLSLTDTPSSFSGEANKGVRVNSGENTLEFYVVTDANSYVTGMTFNSTTGLLSLERNDSLIDVTENLDGRYSLTGHTHSQYITGTTWGDITGILSNQTDLQSELNSLNDGITGNTVDIEQNAADIQLVSGETTTNASDIQLVSGETSTNAGNISTNVTDISTNAADIQLVSGETSTNAGNISTNVTDISTNAADIQLVSGETSTNANNILINASDIQLVSGETTTNAADIVTLSGETINKLDSVQAGTDIGVDNTDPLNPIISVTGASSTDTYVSGSTLSGDNLVLTRTESKPDLITDLSPLLGDVEADIITISGLTVTNASDIQLVSGETTTNASNISTNASDIQLVSGETIINASDIQLVSGETTTNAADIQLVSGETTTNADNISTNVTDISTNVSDIQLVSGETTTNAASIITLSGETINKLDTVVGGTNTTIDDSDPLNPIINVTDNNDNDNFYLTDLGFDTGNGILTATVSGATNQTVDLDGRYVEGTGTDFWKTTGSTTVTTPTIVGDTTFDGSVTIQSGFTITQLPISGTSDQILIRNTLDGVVEYRNLASLGAVTTFLGLTDTPSSFSGQQGKGVRVDTGETVLEFYTVTDANSYVSGMTFNSTTGLLTLERSDALPNVTENLDGRYSLTGHTHSQYITGVVWGDITGTLSDQTDLQDEFDAISGLTVTNAADIQLVSGETITNASNIQLVSGETTTNAGNIQLVSGETTTNASDIQLVSGETITNANNISTNVTDISTNAADIQLVSGETITNANNILTNASDIQLVSGETTTNAGNISTNVTDISTNASDIQLVSGETIINASDIQLVSGETITNAGNISINASDIQLVSGETTTNAANIVTLSGETINKLDSVQAGLDVSIDNTDPLNPIINVTGDTNGNYYLTDLGFDTGTGILTGIVSGASNPSINLDGRYSLTGHTHSVFDRASLLLTGATIFDNIIVTDGITTGISTRNLTPSDIGAQPAGSYDNYQYWNLKMNGAQKKQIQSTNDFNLSGGTDINLSYVAGGTVVINSTFTETPEVNDYLTGATFNTGDGIVTLNVKNQSNVSVDLDGRYSLTGHTHTKLDITDFSDNDYWKTTGITNVTNPTISGNTTFDGNLIISVGNTLTVSSNNDTLIILGRAKLFSSFPDHMMLSHTDRANSTDYSIRQNSLGRTLFNSASGQPLNFRINDIEQWSIESTGNLLGAAGNSLTINDDLILSGTTTSGSTSDDILTRNPTTGVVEYRSSSSLGSEHNLGDHLDTITTGVTTGSMLYNDGTNWIDTNTGLTYGNNNLSLIGTSPVITLRDMDSGFGTTYRAGLEWIDSGNTQIATLNYSGQGGNHLIFNFKGGNDGLSIGRNMGNGEGSINDVFYAGIAADNTQRINIGEVTVIRPDSLVTRLGTTNIYGRLDISGDNLPSSAAYIQLPSRGYLSDGGFNLGGGNRSTILTGGDWNSYILGTNLQAHPSALDGGDVLIDGGLKAPTGTYQGNVKLATQRGQALFGNGTSALPSIAFSNDIDTGIYYDNTCLKFTNSGIQTATISSSGIEVSTANGGMITNTGASLTVPTLLPDKTDSDTGIGGDGANTLALISSGKTVVELNSSEQALFRSGSSVLPSIAFNTSPTTGFYESSNGIWLTSVGNSMYGFTSTYFRPTSDGVKDLGLAANRWRDLFLAPTVSGSTSDNIFTLGTDGRLEYRTTSSLASGHNHDNLYWKVTGTTNVTNPIISGDTSFCNKITSGTGVSGGFRFGDGDSGFYETPDDQLYIQIGTTARWYISSQRFGSLNNGGGSISYATYGSNTISSFHFRGDDDSGINWNSANNFSLITSGSTALTIDSSQFVTLQNEPTQDKHSATKLYVDTKIQGLDGKFSVRLATNAALPSYTTGGTGVGKSLTGTTNGALVIDSITGATNDRILVKDEGSGTSIHNGLYYIVQVGDTSNPYILTRTVDADEDTEITANMYVFVSEGTVWADTGWVLQTNDPITIDTTPLTYVQFSAAGVTTASNGLTKTGNDITLGGSLTQDTTIIVGANTFTVDGDMTISGDTTHGGAILFGDGDTKIHETADDALAITTPVSLTICNAGAARFIYTGTVYRGVSTGSPQLNSQTPQITNLPYSFFGDINTGLYWNSTDNMSIYTGGIEAINIDNTRHVSIESGFTLTQLPTSGDSTQILVRDSSSGEVKYRTASELGSEHALGDHNDTTFSGLVDDNMIYRSGGEWVNSTGITWNNSGKLKILSGGDLFFDTQLDNSSGVGSRIRITTDLGVNQNVMNFGSDSRGVVMSHFQDGGDNACLTLHHRSISTLTEEFIFDTLNGRFYIKSIPVSGASTQILTRNVNTGQIEYTSVSDIGQGHTLNSHSDVDTTGVIDNSILRYNSGTTEWVDTGSNFNVSSSGDLTLTGNIILPSGDLILSGTTTSGSTSDDILTRNPTTGVVEYRSANSFGDDNDYLTGGSFNTGTGNLTLCVQNQSDVVFGLDGRYYLDTNPSGFTSCVGDMTAVTVTTPITGGSTSGSANVGIQVATSGQDGYLTSTDWGTFNNKTTCIGTVTNVTGGVGIDSTEGITPSISLNVSELSVATMTSSDWIVFDNAGVSNKALISTINLSLFNDDLGHTTDTNDYLTGASFNTGTGNLTLSVQNQTDVVQSLDGRYCQTDTNTWIGLTDTTPTGFTSQGGKGVRVNAGETGLEFYTIAADANSYVSGMTFNSGTGLLTLERTDGLPDISDNLDGRYYLDSNPSGFTSCNGTMSSWTLQVDGANTNTIINGENIDFCSGSGIDITVASSTLADITISHANTSSQSSVNNSSRTYIQDVLLDGFGHITGLTSATETVVNTDTNYYLTALGFDTSTGILTGTVSGASNPNIDLDGRYSLTGHTHTKSDITDFSEGDYWKTTGTTNVTNPIISGDTIFDGKISVIGQISGKTGTVSSPSITFGAYPTTGIYSSGLNEIAFTHGGSLKTLFNSNGNVSTALANSWSLRGEVSSTATKAVLIPNKGDLTAGIGGISGEVSIITNDVEAINVSTGQTVSIAKSLFINNGNLDITGTGIIELRASSTTGSPLIRFYQGGTTRRAFIQYVDNGDVLEMANEYGDILLQTGTGGGESNALVIGSNHNITLPDGDLILSGTTTSGSTSDDILTRNSTTGIVEYRSAASLGGEHALSDHTDANLTGATDGDMMFYTGTTWENTSDVSWNGATLTINGALVATSKSFLINHPTKEGKKLQYGSLEGAEFGVYERGRIKGTNIIELPEYWVNLVDKNSITAHLTPVGLFQKLYLKGISNNSVIIGIEDGKIDDINATFTIFGERKDVPKLKVEI